MRFESVGVWLVCVLAFFRRFVTYVVCVAGVSGVGYFVGFVVGFFVRVHFLVW